MAVDQKGFVLEMKGISKSFPGVKALDQVDFALRGGEVHALLGENGAGKSTLMKILAGMYTADSGEILLHRQSINLSSPRAALDRGIAMVYQNFTLSPNLTVLENIVLGSKIPFMMNHKKLKAQVTELLEQYGLHLDLDAKVWQLSVGEQQRVEIMKCFYHRANILILDEPTSVLTPPEVNELFAMIRKITQMGCCVVYISHKLHEVLEIADNITVFRKGRKTATLDASTATQEELTREMVGRDVLLEQDYGHNEPGTTMLRIDSLHVKNDKNLLALKGVSLEIRAGEILGIAAISGNGQAELAEAIAGLRKADSGEIVLAHKHQLHKMSVKEIIDAGVAHISEKRLDRSLVPTFSVADNLVIKDYKNSPYSKHTMVQRKAIKANGIQKMEQFGITAASSDTAVGTLSGGNLQKVVFARELTRPFKVLLAVNPTYGLDVGAIEFMQSQLIEQRDKGAAILLISEELDEVLRLSDRLLVMADGIVTGEFVAGEYDREKIGLLMAKGGASQ